MRFNMNMFNVVFILVLYTTFVVCEDIPTYPHPTNSAQNCYKCTPGFRMADDSTKARSCPLFADGRPTFPDCVECSDGYYMESWNYGHSCNPQIQCNNEGEFILHSGSKLQPNVCGCKIGWYHVDNTCKKVVYQTGDESLILPQEPTTSTTTKMLSTTPEKIKQSSETDKSVSFWVQDFPIFANCYLCPPGYKVEGNLLCDQLPDGSPFFPKCTECSDGYYMDTWNSNNTCKKQRRCDREGEHILNYGNKVNPNMCACKNGWKDSGNKCVEREENKCRSLDDMSTEKTPIAKDLSSIGGLSGNSEPISQNPSSCLCDYKVAVFLSISGTVFVFCFGIYILRQMGYTIHKEEAKKKTPT